MTDDQELVDEIRNCIIQTREEPWGFMAEAVLSVVKSRYDLVPKERKSNG